MVQVKQMFYYLKADDSTELEFPAERQYWLWHADKKHQTIKPMRDFTSHTCGIKMIMVNMLIDNKYNLECINK